MRIMVTGKQGQIVSSLKERAQGHRRVELVAVGRPELDLTDRVSVLKRVALLRPDVVVSAAAYTQVDRAEDEAGLAYEVNARGAGAVAEAAERIGVPIIHVSTDYVFDGNSDQPYTEQSETHPVTVYGLTKLQGEYEVARANPKHIILRTSWVYSPFGSNFVKTMLKLAAERPTVSVVADQSGNPSSALDVADAILLIAANIDAAAFGIFHVTGAGSTTWAEFARHIFAVSSVHGGPSAEVIDIGSADYPSRARRPLNSRLCCDKARQAYGISAPHWKDSSAQVVSRLLPPR